MPIQWPLKTINQQGRHMVDSHWGLINCDPNSAGGDITLVLPPHQIQGVEYFIRDIGTASGSRRIIIETVPGISQTILDYDGNTQSSLTIDSPKAWMKIIALPSGGAWQVIDQRVASQAGTCPCPLEDLTVMYMASNQSTGTTCISPNWDEPASPVVNAWDGANLWFSMTPNALYYIDVMLWVQDIDSTGLTSIRIDDVAPTLANTTVLMAKSFPAITFGETEPVDGGAVTPVHLSGVVLVPALGGKLTCRLCTTGAGAATVLGGEINVDVSIPRVKGRSKWTSYKIEEAPVA